MTLRAEHQGDSDRRDAEDRQPRNRRERPGMAAVGCYGIGLNVGMPQVEQFDAVRLSEPILLERQMSGDHGIAGNPRDGANEQRNVEPP